MTRNVAARWLHRAGGNFRCSPAHFFGKRATIENRDLVARIYGG